MKAELKHLHSPDTEDLQTFEPADPTNFGIFVQAMIGPEGDDASETFDLTVCTPRWLVERVEEQGPMIGLHDIIVASFDYEALLKVVQAFCARCEGDSWQEVGAKLARLGHWEFDDYSE